MRGSGHSNPSSSQNAFSPSFLHRLGERDEPHMAGEADLAGPWRVEEIPGGWGLFREGESPERGFQPFAVFLWRWLADLVAAILPGLGRDDAYRLDKEKDRDKGGFAVRDASGQPVGHLALFDPNLLEALNAADALVRSPRSLASLLEAAGAVALERAGAILDERI